MGAMLDTTAIIWESARLRLLPRLMLLTTLAATTLPTTTAMVDTTAIIWESARLRLLPRLMLLTTLAATTLPTTTAMLDTTAIIWESARLLPRLMLLTTLAATTAATTPDTTMVTMSSESKETAPLPWNQTAYSTLSLYQPIMLSSASFQLFYSYSSF